MSNLAADFKYGRDLGNRPREREILERDPS